ncbi:MAG: hypothetical protein ACR2LX_09840 [Jatrophihabitans sp.]
MTTALPTKINTSAQNGSVGSKFTALFYDSVTAVLRGATGGAWEQGGDFAVVTGTDQDDGVVLDGDIRGVRVSWTLGKGVAAEGVLAGGAEFNDEVAEGASGRRMRIEPQDG